MQHKLSSKSWHFWLANFCADNEIWSTDSVNICEYTRRVLRGILLLVALGVISAASIISTLYGILNLFSVIFLDGYALQPVTYFVLVLYSLIGYALLRAHQEEQARKNPKIAKEPGFLSLWYHKLKEKTCFIVSFED